MDAIASSAPTATKLTAPVSAVPSTPSMQERPADPPTPRPQRTQAITRRFSGQLARHRAHLLPC